MANDSVISISFYQLILHVVPARFEGSTSQHNRFALLLHRSMPVQQPSNDIPINRFHENPC